MTLPDELPLPGGLAQAGTVVRIAGAVHRPSGPHTLAVHALLRHLEESGFDGAPRVLGFDQIGRSRLTYLEGEVGRPPYPRWVADDGLLDGVAGLQRRFHDAVASFHPPDGAVWDRTLASPLPGPPGRQLLVGHNDLSIENVVCRGGRPVALIDFDFAAPTDPLWDVAIALRHWVPVRDPADLGEAHHGVDQVARFRRYCNGYRVARSERGQVVDLLGAFLRQALDRMRERSAAGLPAYQAVWRAGYPEQNLRAQQWLAAHAAALARH